jgi:hypothetical protein
VARLPLDLLGLLATRLDVCREAKLFDDVTHFVVVVALIQAHALRLLD